MAEWLDLSQPPPTPQPQAWAGGRAASGSPCSRPSLVSTVCRLVHMAWLTTVGSGTARFPLLRWAVTDVVLLAWPEIWVDVSWVSASDMSANVLQDLGTFESRDAMFTETGKTFCPPASVVLVA